MPAKPSQLDALPYLREISLLREQVPNFDEYPFSLPAVRSLHRLTFHPHVTFLVGENGTGKSTLLEAIAQLLRFNAEGGSRNVRFATRDTHSDLHNHLKMVCSFKMPTDGYFLRAESFYNVASYIDEVEVEGSYGGKSLHAQSHGESFLALLTQRFRGNGIYLLDEPEAALSPSRQLSAMAVIHQLVQANSQFIIATHSPILLAYPQAKIVLLDEDGLHETAYEDTDHYRVTRDFLTQRERMLKVLLEEEAE